MKRFALIVAGGNGTRMGTEVPKQFLVLGNKPVLMHTIEAFAEFGSVEIILVLPEQQIAKWRQLCEQFPFTVPHKIIHGGETRFHSVRNGLEAVTEGLVAIHDGVRPLVNKRMIRESYELAEAKGNAIAAVKLKDSIREMMLTGGNRNVNRNNYYLIQTPQTFQSSLIKEAYGMATYYNFTDDAGVLEEAGGKINLFEGDYRNIKITTPEDLEIAAIWLKH